jgi:hypothetical protein
MGLGLGLELGRVELGLGIHTPLTKEKRFAKLNTVRNSFTKKEPDVASHFHWSEVPLDQLKIRTNKHEAAYFNKFAPTEPLKDAANTPQPHHLSDHCFVSPSRSGFGMLRSFSDGI